MLEHDFTGPSFTVGVEEELMLCNSGDLDLAQRIDDVLAELPGDLPGQVKHELMQSVLEIATDPCTGVAEVATQLRDLRRGVAEVCSGLGLALGAAGTHPTARWEDQKIVEHPRYRALTDELGWIAQRELIFGTHIHIGVEGAERAIYIADGIRGFLPLLLAMSSNSPLWRGRKTGLMSSRTPVFRAFPRVGIPPYYGNWEIYAHRVDRMVKSGAVPDYTYLWWDVRPHPKLGTVEIRVMDQQTRLEATVGFAALAQCLVHRLSTRYDDGAPNVEHPLELIDDNKVRAAIYGLEGKLIDFDRGFEVPAATMARDVLADLREHAQELGCEGELEWLGELIDRGTGARRQLDWLESGDLASLRAEIIAASAL